MCKIYELFIFTDKMQATKKEKEREGLPKNFPIKLLSAVLYPMYWCYLTGIFDSCCKIKGIKREGGTFA